MRHFISSVISVAILACATPRTMVYVAPTNETVHLISEEMQMSPGHVLYVENGSSVPITVTSVQLTSCENIKNRCDFHKMSIQVDPRSKRQIMRVEADNPTRGFFYRSSFGWRAEGTPVTIQPDA